MGLLFRWKSEKGGDNNEIADRNAAELLAREHVWDRELSRLGRAEVLHRLAALSDYRGGRTGPSGFESWSQQIEREILTLTQNLTRRGDG